MKTINDLNQVNDAIKQAFDENPDKPILVRINPLGLIDKYMRDNLRGDNSSLVISNIPNVRENVLINPFRMKDRKDARLVLPAGFDSSVTKRIFFQIYLDKIQQNVVNYSTRIVRTYGVPFICLTESIPAESLKNYEPLFSVIECVEDVSKYL